MKTIIENKTLNFILLVLISLVFVLIYSFSSSPLYVNDGMDSAIFKLLGRAIIDGRMPYSDIFDHKGPLIFYVNALGELLHRGKGGVLILQTINLTATLYILYKLFVLFISSKKAVFICLFFLLLLCGLLPEGDLCEEWMLPYISLSLYFVARRVKTPKCSTRGDRLPFALIGICFAVVFFFRPNDAISSVGASAAGLGLNFLLRKEFKSFLLLCGYFLSGVLVVTAPVVLYFMVKGSLHDMLYGMIGFNMAYSQGIAGLLSACLREKYFMLLILLASAIPLLKSSQRDMLFIIVPNLLLQWLLIGSNVIVHYFIVVLPVVCMVTAVLMSTYRTGTMAIWLALLLLPVFPSIRSHNRNVAKCLLGNGNRQVQAFYKATAPVFGSIPQKDRDDVWNYNLAYITGRAYDISPLSAFYHYNIVPCNRLIMWWHYCFDSEFSDPESITAHHPKWVIVDMQSEYLPDITYIEEHYSVYAQSDTSVCDIRLYGLGNN